MNFKSKLEEKVYSAIKTKESLLVGYTVEKEKLWKDLFSNHKKGREAVDFYFKEIKVILEVNGKQHYEPTSFTSEDIALDNYERQLKRDKKLKDYCKQEKIDLVSISYKTINELDIDSLSTYISKRIINAMLGEE